MRKEVGRGIGRGRKEGGGQERKGDEDEGNDRERYESEGQTNGGDRGRGEGRSRGVEGGRVKEEEGKGKGGRIHLPDVPRELSTHQKMMSRHNFTGHPHALLKRNYLNS